MVRPLHPKPSGSPTLAQRISDAIALYRVLSSLAKKIYGDQSSLRFLQKWFVFCALGIRHHDLMASYLYLFQRNNLHWVTDNLPLVLEKPFKPYVCATWTLTKRFEELEVHYQLLDKVFGKNVKHLYSVEGYELARFTIKSGETFLLEFFPDYLNEGSLGIRLCTVDQLEVYSISFHLNDQLSISTCYVGAVQGPNDRIPDRQAMIVRLTKSLHGLRPQALMVEALYCVLHCLGIKRILAVTNHSHIYQARGLWNSKRHVVSFDIDALWKDFKAIPADNDFMQLPIKPNRKSIQTVRTNKRSLYKKRYQWLQQLGNEIDSSMLDIIINKDLVKSDRANFPKAA